MELEKAKTPIGVDEKQLGDTEIMTDIPLQRKVASLSQTNIAPDQTLNRNEILHSKRLYWIGRRTQDIIFSTIAILVLWPLVLICAILIVIDSPGASPFFVQERVGRDGKKFQFINLRCMELVRVLNEKLEYIRALFCSVQTTNFCGGYFRHQNGVFPAVETG